MRRLELAWDGEAFWPLSADRLLAREVYGQGEIVAFSEAKDRSSPSHRHYFASLREAWVNLPEGYAERFATEGAPTQVGADPHRLLPEPAPSSAAQEPRPDRSPPSSRSNDAYALVSLEGRTIWHLTAMSQSLEAMDHRPSRRASAPCSSSSPTSSASSLPISCSPARARMIRYWETSARSSSRALRWSSSKRADASAQLARRPVRPAHQGPAPTASPRPRLPGLAPPRALPRRPHRRRLPRYQGLPPAHVHPRPPQPRAGQQGRRRLRLAGLHPPHMSTTSTADPRPASSQRLGVDSFDLCRALYGAFDAGGDPGAALVGYLSGGVL